MPPPVPTTIPVSTRTSRITALSPGPSDPPTTPNPITDRSDASAARKMPLITVVWLPTTATKPLLLTETRVGLATSLTHPSP